MNATMNPPRVKVGLRDGGEMSVPLRDGMMAGDAFSAAGITLGNGEGVSISGRRGDLRTPLQPDETVVPAPLINNG